MDRPSMDSAKLIAYINAIRIGDLDGIRAKLDEARKACVELEQADLADKLTEASSALSQLDMKTYRKRLETVIARLGHLK
jgi:hypothetical protein